MKLWQKATAVKQEVEEFTVGKDRELDLLLAPFDVLGSLAHTRMLHSINLMTAEDLDLVHQELKNIYREIQSGKFTIEEGVEDVHSQVELLLTRRIGEAGKKIHSGRSRNDQVLLDLKLFIRSEIQNTVEEIKELFYQLISLSEEHKDKLLPGYTHLQIAMPSSFGLWFGAYAESLVDDLLLLLAAYKISNKNPLGSAAGYGSSFPLNRQMTTDLLGFDALNYNVVYAQMGRGKTERNVSSALASVAGTLAKLAMDACLYMNQNFGFISLPEELTTGSSIMPHKKNPDVFEIIRGKCNKLQALPNEIALITANLPSGYHRDLQVVKESFLPAFRELQSCLSMMTFMLKNIIVKDNILKDEKYSYLFSVEVVNNEVLQGVPFREAYKNVGSAIANGTFVAPEAVNHTHEGSIGNLNNNNIIGLMNEVMQGFNFLQVTKAQEELVAD
ncbi:argininosuccinate lyase [Adhaeribacter rhizoryzae]|uniref:Argininosuccinate lyase n=1 Tax=Adhaeribacter rhizoryzae TaxID=2607907 RepID=A0A5M6DJP9_9BACT|nr:argininosuccinate lyase [Adhaeribacter rhizoryzae]KAA5547778.1 argininosuccinate lyase [Adhaeribacter rhizoryzae]